MYTSDKIGHWKSFHDHKQDDCVKRVNAMTTTHDGISQFHFLVQRLKIRITQILSLSLFTTWWFPLSVIPTNTSLGRIKINSFIHSFIFFFFVLFVNLFTFTHISYHLSHSVKSSERKRKKLNYFAKSTELSFVHSIILYFKPQWSCNKTLNQLHSSGVQSKQKYMIQIFVLSC